MSAITPIPIVLQGEFAVIKGDEKNETMIKTSIPNSCTVFTLYNNESKLSVLAHIDDFSSVIDTMDKISKFLINNYKKPITHCGFKAKILGGTSDKFSVQQHQLVLNSLKRLNISCEVVSLPQETAKRPQIALNARNGNVVFLEVNNCLEYLQKREYGEWNNILDDDYKDLPGDQIPFFKIKEAKRMETDIPQFKMINIEHAKSLEQQKKLTLPIQATRKVARDTKSVIAKLQKLLQEIPNATALKTTIEQQDFNLLLRQSSMCKERLKLLVCLLAHRLKLNIDIASRGKTSGTAMDVAKKYTNQEAIDLLEIYQ